MVRLLLPLLAGIWIGQYYRPEAGQWLVVGLLLLYSGLASYVLLHYQMAYLRLFGAWIFLAVLVLGAWRSNQYYALPVGIDACLDSTAQYNGILTEILKTGKKQKAIANVSRIGSADPPLQVLLYLPIDSLQPPEAGQSIGFEARLQRIPPPPNPHAFDYRAYLKHKRIHCQAFLQKEAYQLRSPAGFSWRQWIFRIRKGAVDMLARHLPGRQERDLVAALVLGDQRNMSEDLSAAYRNTGAVHILSVSGLHVAIVCHIILLISGFLFKRHKLLQTIFALLALAFYVALSGAGPAVLRSGIMCALLICAYLARGKHSLPNALAASAVLLLVWQPGQFRDVGFQLSYLALAGMIVFQPLFQRLTARCYRIPKCIDDLLCAGFAAQLATFPLVLYYFHQFPWYFWLSGLLAIPLAEGLLWVGILTLMLGLVSASLGVLLGYLLFALAWLQNRIILWVASLPGAVSSDIWLPELSVCLLLIALACLAHAWMQRSGSYLLYCSMALCAACVSIFKESLQFDRQDKLIIYNTRQALLADHFSARHCVSWAPDTLSALEESQAAGPCRAASGIRALQHEYGFLRDSGYLYSKLWIMNKQLFSVVHPEWKKQGRLPAADYLVVYGETPAPDPANTPMRCKQVILCRSLARKYRQAWKDYLQKQDISLHEIATEGAFSFQ